jgi:hypothetical protein
MWHRNFRVGNVGVTVGSTLTSCAAILEPLCRLYTDSTDAPTLLHFRIEPRDGQIHLSINEKTLWQGTDAGEIAAGFEVHLYQRLLAALLPDFLSLHAGCVELGGQACLFAAASGAGKSSLTTAAVLDGANYLSDEFALLGSDGRISPFPRPLQWGKLRHPAFRHAQMLHSGKCSKALFRFPDRYGRTVTTLLWLPAMIRHAPLPLGIVVLPQYMRRAPAAEMAPIRRGEALMELPRHLHHRLPPEIMLQALNRRIPATTRFYRLQFSDARIAWRTIRDLPETTT